MPYRTWLNSPTPYRFHQLHCPPTYPPQTPPPPKLPQTQPSTRLDHGHGLRQCPAALVQGLLRKLLRLRVAPRRLLASESRNLGIGFANGCLQMGKMYIRLKIDRPCGPKWFISDDLKCLNQARTDVHQVNTGIQDSSLPYIRGLADRALYLAPLVSAKQGRNMSFKVLQSVPICPLSITPPKGDILCRNPFCTT